MGDLPVLCVDRVNGRYPYTAVPFRARNIVAHVERADTGYRLRLDDTSAGDAWLEVELVETPAEAAG